MTIKLLPLSTTFLPNLLTASCEADSTIISVSLKEDEETNFVKSVNVLGLLEWILDPSDKRTCSATSNRATIDAFFTLPESTAMASSLPIAPHPMIPTLFEDIYYLLPPRSGLFCPGNLLFSKRLTKLFLFRTFDTGLNLGLPWTFGVCPLTLPALVSDPCVGMLIYSKYYQLPI